MQQIACTTAPGAGGPPKCRPGDSAGTMYTVFPTGACEGEWATDARAALTPLFVSTPQLYAAVEVKAPNPDSEPSWPKGQYAVIFTTGGRHAAGHLLHPGRREHPACTCDVRQWRRRRDPPTPPARCERIPDPAPLVARFRKRGGRRAASRRARSRRASRCCPRWSV